MSEANLNDAEQDLPNQKIFLCSQGAELIQQGG